MAPTKIGFIVPPGIFTGGQSKDEQDQHIIDKIEKIYSNIKDVSNYETVVDTTYPLGMSIAQISMSYHVTVTRVQPFTQSIYGKIHPTRKDQENINLMCSGFIILGSGAYSPTKMNKCHEYISKNSDKLIVIGPDKYKEKYENEFDAYLPTPLQPELTNAIEYTN